MDLFRGVLRDLIDRAPAGLLGKARIAELEALVERGERELAEARRRAAAVLAVGAGVLVLILVVLFFSLR